MTEKLSNKSIHFKLFKLILTRGRRPFYFRGQNHNSAFLSSVKIKTLSNIIIMYELTN